MCSLYIFTKTNRTSPQLQVSTPKDLSNNLFSTFVRSENTDSDGVIKRDFLQVRLSDMQTGFSGLWKWVFVFQKNLLPPPSFLFLSPWVNRKSHFSSLLWRYLISLTRSKLRFKFKFYFKSSCHRSLHWHYCLLFMLS